MKIGIALPDNAPESFRICVENIVSYFPQLSVDYFLSIDVDELCNADVIWDPCSGGAKLPDKAILEINLPLVVTLHGVAPLALASQYAKGFHSKIKVCRSNRQKRRHWDAVQKKCAKIVTVSEFSKRSITEHLPIPVDKIAVVHNGVDRRLFENAGTSTHIADRQISCPYFLHISNDEQRKNIDRLLEAYTNLDASSRWPLVIKLGRRRITGIYNTHVIPQRLDDSEVAALYSGAGAFLFPSLYEGFGLPILEAMSAGCPVITSRSTACMEVAGAAAVLIDPYSVQALTQAMAEIQSNESLRDSLSAKGKIRAAEFTWENAAQEYIEVFEAAAKCE